MGMGVLDPECFGHGLQAMVLDGAAGDQLPGVEGGQGIQDVVVARQGDAVVSAPVANQLIVEFGDIVTDQNVLCDATTRTLMEKVHQHLPALVRRDCLPFPDSLIVGVVDAHGVRLHSLWVHDGHLDLEPSGRWSHGFLMEAVGTDLDDL